MSDEKYLISLIKASALYIAKTVEEKTEPSDEIIKYLVSETKAISKWLGEIAAQRGDNWLFNWTPPFDFTGIGDSQIALYKLQIEQYVREYMRVNNMTQTVMFVWKTDSAKVMYTLEAYLNPAFKIPPGGGGPGSTLDPTPPGKP